MGCGPTGAHGPSVHPSVEEGYRSGLVPVTNLNPDMGDRDVLVMTRTGRSAIFSLVQVRGTLSISCIATEYFTITCTLKTH